MTKEINPKSRSRAWCLTINNYTEEELECITGYSSEYTIVGNETCPTSGTKHLQCYIRMTNTKTFSKMKKDFPRAHIEIAGGNDLQNKAYCSKESVLYESGTPSKQGKRSDLEKISNMILESPRMNDMIDKLSNLQAIRTAEKLLMYKEPQRNWKPTVLWFCGRSGTGKSKLAAELLPDAYWAMDTGKWWEGYDGHEQVIIDDMRADFLPYNQLLKLLDRYPYRLEVKGGSRQFLAKTIIITSPYSPDQMFGVMHEDNKQLLRRIDKIKYFDNI